MTSVTWLQCVISPTLTGDEGQKCCSKCSDAVFLSAAASFSLNCPLSVFSLPCLMLMSCLPWIRWVHLIFVKKKRTAHALISIYDRDYRPVCKQNTDVFIQQWYLISAQRLLGRAAVRPEAAGNIFCNLSSFDEILMKVECTDVKMVLSHLYSYIWNHFKKTGRQAKYFRKSNLDEAQTA